MGRRRASLSATVAELDVVGARAWWRAPLSQLSLPAVLAASALTLALAPTAMGQVVKSTTLILDTSGGDGAGGYVLGYPFGLTVDAFSNVYVSGQDSHNVLRVTPDGVVSQLINQSGDGLGNTLDYPMGVAVDGLGNVYVTGNESDNVFRITPSGEIVEILDATGDGHGNTFDRPWDIAADASGNAYVPGLNSQKTFRISLSGEITKICDWAAFDIAVDAAGNVYMAGTKMSPDGTVIGSIDASGDGLGHPLDLASDVAVDSAGNWFVVGLNSNNVFKIAPDGIITQIIDASGDGAGNTLSAPSGVAVDSAGNVYVTAIASENAFQITPAGVVTEILDFSAVPSSSSFLYAVATDVSGDVYISCSQGPGPRGVVNFPVYKLDIEPIGTWTDLGLGLAGSNGLPVLSASGYLQEATPLTLSLSQAKPFAVAPLLVGVSALNAPFKGGVLVPHPDLIFPLFTDFFGSAGFGGILPSGLPSNLLVYFQWWVQDAAGPSGFAASNAVSALIP